MRLFEAIIEANHRAVTGDGTAGLRPGDYAESLPVAALTCIDARLNPFFPEVLGLPKEQFIWLRNAGNIITGPMSSTMRSLALACAVKGAREIAIIGHTDCQVRKTSSMQLMESFGAVGVRREVLPDNLTEFFGLFASEQQNVMKAVDFVRRSPLIGPKIPVHGLIVDTGSGRLEWVVNGYQTLEIMASPMTVSARPEETANAFASIGDFKISEMKFPEGKIGDVMVDMHQPQPEAAPTPEPPPPAPEQKLKPPKIAPPRPEFLLRPRGRRN